MNDMQSVAAFLASRRSFPPALLGAPFPDDSSLRQIAQMGLRVPDHKKLEPWRLIALRGAALDRLSALVAEHVADYQPIPEKAAKMVDLYQNAGAVIAMVFSLIESDDVPDWEEWLSMGAVGVSLVNAAIANGYGAAWMSGFLPECPEIGAYLGLGDGERLAGLVHIGTAKGSPPERPRPDIEKKLSFL